jgi:hypothetical protein
MIKLNALFHNFTVGTRSTHKYLIYTDSNIHWFLFWYISGTAVADPTEVPDYAAVMSGRIFKVIVTGNIKNRITKEEPMKLSVETGAKTGSLQLLHIMIRYRRC